MNNDLIAKAFACSNDSEQADILNKFARTLYMHCKGRPSGIGGFETQCCMLVNQLNKDGEDLILELAEFVRLKREDIR